MDPRAHHLEHSENQVNVGTQAREVLAQHALTLYQCPDGSLVNHPSECKEGLISKQLTFNNIFEQLQG